MVVPIDSSKRILKSKFQFYHLKFESKLYIIYITRIFGLLIKKNMMISRMSRYILYICHNFDLRVLMTRVMADVFATLTGLTRVSYVTPIFKHISFKPFQICGSIFVHYSRPINI